MTRQLIPYADRPHAYRLMDGDTWAGTVWRYIGGWNWALFQPVGYLGGTEPTETAARAALLGAA